MTSESDSERSDSTVRLAIKTKNSSHTNVVKSASGAKKTGSRREDASSRRKTVVEDSSTEEEEIYGMEIEKKRQTMPKVQMNRWNGLGRQ